MTDTTTLRLNLHYLVCRLLGHSWFQPACVTDGPAPTCEHCMRMPHEV